MTRFWTGGWACGAAAAAAMLAPSAAAAQQVFAVTLEPGQSIELDRDPVGGGLRAGSIGEPLPLSEYDRVTIARFAAGHFAGSTGPNVVYTRSGEDGMPETDPVGEDRIRFSFLALPDDGQRLLIVENGFDGDLFYRANIRVDGEMTSTDVCSVMPRNRGYEHWPFAIESIELGGFGVIPHNPGQASVCQ